jgi:hypothetical protein
MDPTCKKLKKILMGEKQFSGKPVRWMPGLSLKMPGLTTPEKHRQTGRLA